MSVYLETNALRKLTNYMCEEPVYTSVFSIFELLSGITEKEFKVRKACLERIAKQKIEIRGPMIDKLFMEMLGVNEYNHFAYEMIMDIYQATLKAESYSDFVQFELLVTNINNKLEAIHAHTWLKNWDDNISNITKNITAVFQDENKDYVKQIYKKDGVKGLSRYFWNKMYMDRIDEKRLSHAEGFIGADAVENIRRETDILFSKYSYKLFLQAQAAIFSKAYFVNGNSQNSNNASDLLHLLYLNENDKFVSNDNIYRTISEACPEFKLMVLDKEKNLSELI